MASKTVKWRAVVIPEDLYQRALSALDQANELALLAQFREESSEITMPVEATPVEPWNVLRGGGRSGGRRADHVRSQIRSEIEYLKGSIEIGDLEPAMRAFDRGKLQGIEYVKHLVFGSEA